MRDIEAIDFELRLIAEVRVAIRDDGGDPSRWQADKLLDERLAITSDTARTARRD